MTVRRCPCGKVAYRTLGDARNAKWRIATDAQSSDPVRYYACNHGRWHWTRQGVPEALACAEVNP